MKHILTLAALVFATSCFGQESFFDTLSEAGFSFIYEGEQSSFYLSSTSTDWIDARAICQELGGDLASFSSEQESIQVGQLLSTHVLIGLYQDTSSSSYSEPSGGWVWTSGEALDWNLWQSTKQGTEPNNVNGGEDVAELFDGYYNDLPDNYAGYPFLLEISHGCMEESACNYNPEANVDDGSCLDCALFEERCGPGTMWDETTQLCVIANPSDTNFDGCVSMTDLLDLLSVFGTCNETPWSCGDPLEYQGYDYETVQIGGQCWFAENLRAEQYSNGDPIPMILDDAEWQGSSEGARCWINNDSTFFGFPGFLYHGYAVTDNRGVCPEMWHVANDLEWMALEIAHGLSEFEAHESGIRGGDIQLSQKMRVESWGGTNELGFAAQKGGYRRWENGSFSGGIDSGAYWSNGDSLGGPGYREFHGPWEGVARGEIGISEGLSIRCIKDSE